MGKAIILAYYPIPNKGSLAIMNRAASQKGSAIHRHIFLYHYDSFKQRLISSLIPMFIHIPGKLPPVSGYSGKIVFDSGGTFTFKIIYTTIGLDCTRAGSYTANANLEYSMTITSIKGCDQVQDKHTEEKGKLIFSNGDKAMTMEQNDDVTTEWARIS